MTDKEAILNDPEKLKALAAQMRAEADGAEARAEKLKVARAQAYGAARCTVSGAGCIMVEPV